MDNATHHPDAEARKRHQAFVDFMIPIVKGCSTEVAQQVTYLGVQVHGGMGFIEETGAAQHYRDARITTIYEGTTGIQANDLIGRKTARDGGAVARAILADIAKVAAQCPRRPTPTSRRSVRHSVRRRPRSAKPSTGSWATSRASTRAAHAAAVPYLQMWGLVAGGWQLARGALIASKQLADGEADASFFAARSPRRASTPNASCRRPERSVRPSRAAAKRCWRWRTSSSRASYASSIARSSAS